MPTRPDLQHLKLKPRLLVLWQLRPHRSRLRNWTALSLWAVIFTIGLYAFQHHTLPPVPGNVAAADGTTSTAAPKATPAVLASTTKITSLPGGPTDQLLPPGTMAPANTFANSYSRGQCTWYVAGRRQVPAGWGNAKTWFGRAQAAGWKTGATPAIAAIAWTPTGYFGHVALVESVDVPNHKILISEMNFRGPYKVDQRWVSINDFKYIY